MSPPEHTDPAAFMIRPAGIGDLAAVARLVANARRQLINLAGDDLEQLIQHAPGVLLIVNQQIQAALIGGVPAGQTIWLRVLAVANQLRAASALALLIPAFHTAAREIGIRACYYGGDSESDGWLAVQLAALGYQHDTDVLSYAKHDLTIPSSGSVHVQIRDSHSSDLPTLLAIDQACFEPQWLKREPIMADVLASSAFIRVAAINGQPVGYTFAMSYYGGRQLHLVRIAVVPGTQGHGVGIRLMADLITYARTQHVDILTLNTQAYNTRARRLYEWFGFHRTGEQQLIMRHDL